jgi:hypothetical protein
VQTGRWGLFLVIAWPRTLLMISILKRALHIDELVAFQG